MALAFSFATGTMLYVPSGASAIAADGTASMATAMPVMRNLRMTFLVFGSQSVDWGRRTDQGRWSQSRRLSRSRLLLRVSAGRGPFPSVRYTDARSGHH